jgi:hypothetical protein
VYVERNIEARGSNNFCRYAKRMRNIILSSAASLAPQYFSALSHERDDFRVGGSYWTSNICLNIVYSFVWNIYRSEKKN